MSREELLDYIVQSKEEIKAQDRVAQTTKYFNENITLFGPFKDIAKKQYINFLKLAVKIFIAKNKALDYIEIEEVLEDFSDEQVMELFK